jgi:hypothetical protein
MESASTFPILGAVCGGLVVLLVAALGGYLVFASIRGRRKAQASQNWPTATGRVLEARLQHSTTSDAEGDMTTSYYPQVEYEYVVQGQTFHGNKIAFGPQKTSSSQSKAQTTLASYPPGVAIPVYYNPVQPQEAVLEKSAPAGMMGLIIGIILVVISACLGLGGAFALLLASVRDIGG